MINKILLVFVEPVRRKAKKLETTAPCVANRVESLCRGLPGKRHVSSSDSDFSEIKNKFPSQMEAPLRYNKQLNVPRNPSPLTVFIKQSPELLYTRPFPELERDFVKKYFENLLHLYLQVLTSSSFWIFQIQFIKIKATHLFNTIYEDTNLSVGWFITRAFTTSAGVPIIAPTSL